MPFPLIPVIIVGVSLLFAGGVTTVVLKWDDIMLWWKGKKIVVLGTRGVGKTTLIEFLFNGHLPESYQQTVRPTNAKGRRFSLKDLQLDVDVKSTIDLPGSKDYYSDWKKAVLSSDVVIYLARTDEILSNDVKKNRLIINEIRHIRSWISESSQNKKIYILTTYADYIDKFNASDDIRDKFIESFRNLPSVRNLILHAGGGDSTRLIVGSMVDTGETESLIYNLFMEIK